MEQPNRTEDPTTLLEVTEIAQSELGKALGAEPGKPQSIRLVFDGHG